MSDNTPVGFGDVFESEYLPLVEYARRIGSGPADAEDAVQAAFEDLLLAWPAVDDPAAWLREAVRSQVNRVLRSERRLIRRAAAEPDPEDTIDVSDRMRRLTDNVDNGWWDQLEAHREELVGEAARALTHPLRRTARGSAREVVDETYAQARHTAPDLRWMTPVQRRRWLLNSTLDRVARVLRRSAR